MSEEWNQPNRTDYYLMAIAGTLMALLTKNEKWLDPEKHKLTFGNAEEERRTNPDIKQAISKAHWIGAVGGMNVVRRKRKKK